MEDVETSEVPCSLGHLIDPTAALEAAQRLYAAPGSGICHSAWEGRTLDRKRAAAQRSKRGDDHDDELAI